MEEKIKVLLNSYYDIFPNDGLFPEWDEATNSDKIKMLEESLKKKVDISQTELFNSKYMESVLNDTK